MMLGSHLGRPDGQTQARVLARAGRRPPGRAARAEVTLADEAVGDGARKVAADVRDGHVAMLENLRFHPGEEANDDGVRAHAGVVLRRLRQRRVRHRAPRPRLDRGHGASTWPRARRLRDGQGDRLPVAPARRRRSAVPGGGRRRQGVGQDRRARRPARPGQRPHRRRRHGQHLPRGAGRAAGQEPGRARQAADRPQLPAQGAPRPRSRSTCRPTWWWPRGSTPAPGARSPSMPSRPI
jgi:hypothetical protein